MERHRILVRVVIKYTLLQIPGTVLFILILLMVRRWVDLSQWLFWGLVGAWVAKEVVLFPFVWRSYDSGESDEENRLVGLRGIAEEPLNPSGYVRVGGELWRAEIKKGPAVVEKGGAVRIRAVQGLTILVEPEETGSPDEPMSSLKKSPFDKTHSA